MAGILRAPITDGVSTNAPNEDFHVSTTATTPTPTDDAIPSDATTIVAPLADKHTHTVIFLHGREDYGCDLAQYFFDSKASDGRTLAGIFPSIRWVFPTARLRYSAQRDFEFSNSSFAEALKGEEIISQWFDVWDIATPEDREELMIAGLQESIGDIVQVIREEAQRVPLSRIILGGISQGCATAILALMYTGMDLGGFVGLSSWLPFQKKIEKLPVGTIDNKDEARHIKDILSMSPDMDAALHIKKANGPVPRDFELEPEPEEGTTNRTDAAADAVNLEASISTLSISSKAANRTPVFLAHSQDDETVPFALGEGLHQTIEHLGFEVTWKKYEEGGHWIHPKHGVDDISAFLRRVLEF
ncbi:Acyl-protein thioesterase [Lachnellula occidentalis]|uniref:Acyl-protein thioesterase n=1 Tax=Lachnellula occidentalis TaxID=215460 RepID=A0A8H8RH74_9HELO|nr:Acyl-protein thioesterase [Lachnellula occidentalis]